MIAHEVSFVSGETPTMTKRLSARVVERIPEQLSSGTGVVLAFLLLVVVGSILSPEHFLTRRNITNILQQSSMLGVVAVGMTFVILTAGIDLSVGMVLSLCSVVAALLFDNGEGYSLPLVLLVTLALGAGMGAFNAAIVVWRRVAPFIVTLAMMAIAGGAALTISGGKPIGGIKEAYALLGASHIGWLPIPVPGLIMLTAYVVGGFVLHLTPYGRQVYAIGGNEEAARLSGIPVNRVKLITYMISGGSAALGAIIFTARVTVGDPMGGTRPGVGCHCCGRHWWNQSVWRRGPFVEHPVGNADHHHDQQPLESAQRVRARARACQGFDHPGGDRPV